MNSLPARIASAITVFLFFVLAYYFFRNNGLVWTGALACLLGAFEFQNILLSQSPAPRFLRGLFIVIVGLFLWANITLAITALPLITLLIVIYLTLTLWACNNKLDNTQILHFMANSIMGFIYCALLPSFAIKLLNLPKGEFWFLFLLVIVFAGDIAAYFGGIAFGVKKIAPQFSPSKTLAGAISGVAGSCLAGSIIWYFSLNHFNFYIVLSLSVAGALLAQSGDFFESLLKRVANAKDSGQIMPGHGGILDRLDGVYFAAPLVYAAATLLSH